MRTYPIPFNEEARLCAMHKIPGLSPENEALFDHLCDATRKLFDCPIAHISVIEDETQWYKSVVGMELPTMPKDQSFCTHAIMSDEVMVIPDLSADPKFERHPMVAEGGPGARFYAGVPLVLSSGYRIGSLCALDLKPHEMPSDNQIELLKALGKAAEAALEKTPAVQAVSDIDRGQSAFVTLVSHELKTPLTVLLGGLRLIEMRAEDPASQKLARSAHRSAAHLSQLVESIMRYSNAATGEIHLNETETDLSEVLREAVEIHLPGAQDAGKGAELGTLEVTGPVLADAEHLKLALTALALNALFHGGQNMRLSTRHDAQGNIEIRVSDDGALDEKLDLAELYKPFVVGDEMSARGTRGGLGLGLPLTRKLIELHGGEFLVEAEPAQTTAVIRLPHWRALAGAKVVDTAG
ncbi:GAF domain-containing sensor histidine kinase [Roseivivax sp. GX 12232]|uniref:GAF domain-containing sensor histidine kinase n=1 Tax=Roseivivax sp. GX 12232 TaxID=2900547 RepID=UPI001E4E64B9|nr:GAF domain-containing sensor histidine kinase [Roseivivax sp. GX 12232]MCE0503857.1 GAF domain-containing sensor histidine kinase [Roseivivax sp. GX 12232]